MGVQQQTSKQSSALPAAEPFGNGEPQGVHLLLLTSGSPESELHLNKERIQVLAVHFSILPHIKRSYKMVLGLILWKDVLSTGPDALY